MSDLRLAAGTCIDRSRPFSFTFDRRVLKGFAGDTVASALLASGIRLVGRSFRLHRPRGILSCGIEEPNALVHVRLGAYEEPNARATIMPLQEGLEVFSQNSWPSLRWDAGELLDLVPKLFAAGFYHKTTNFTTPSVGEECTFYGCFWRGLPYLRNRTFPCMWANIATDFWQ